MDVWVPDKQEAFVLGHVVSRTEKQVVVTVDGMEKTVKSKDAMEVNPSSQDGVADNTELMYLNDAALLHNLKVRYMDDQIYTYTGNILTALNPFQRLPIYGEEEIFKYSHDQGHVVTIRALVRLRFTYVLR
jgi:myosin heavy subunit